jgi:DNA polymerase-3 subunit delta'
MAWEMIGHEWAVRLLHQHIATGQVRHAYLFSGPDAVGKRTLALRFAQALNCEAPPAPGETCGNCRACELTPEQTYPDLHVVEAEWVGGSLKVEQVRDLQRKLALSPYEGRWRVALMLRFHEANDSAANALLKTLEEPAPQVVLLLTARSQEALLPTIVSRCEVIPLRALADSELEKALQGRGLSYERARLLAGLSSGCPGRAIRLQEDPAQLEQRRLLLDDLQSLLQMSRAERFAYIDRLMKGKDLGEMRRQVVEALETWLSVWRDAMIVTFGVQASPNNPDRITDLEILTSVLDPEQLVRAVQETERTLDAIHHYANVRLALENLMLDLPKVMVG